MVIGGKYRVIPGKQFITSFSDSLQQIDPSLTSWMKCMSKARPQPTQPHTVAGHKICLAMDCVAWATWPHPTQRAYSRQEAKRKMKSSEALVGLMLLGRTDRRKGKAKWCAACDMGDATPTIFTAGTWSQTAVM
ncbi:hypothetical protein J1614_000426 [Plenodomus biglobosus]|nr:hypothetical protein J1614_000426 [Plenodomus biglobosus]